MSAKQRHYELDWLRIFLVLAVFLHHVGMPFNGDGFVIMNADSSKLLDDIMVYFEQFRLPLLFLIAGAGSTLFLTSRKPGEFIKQRTMRLLVPLVVAILLIVPPQNYFGHIDQFESYTQAYPTLISYLSTAHLWFIEFLVVFALLSVPVQRFLQTQLGQQLLQSVKALAAKPWGLFVFASVLMLLRIVSKIWFPDDDKHITNLSVSMYFGFFYLMGMVLMSSPQAWQYLGQYRRFNLYVLLVSSVIFYGYYYSPDLSPYLSQPVRWALWRIVASLVGWSATLTLLGYAQRYLNHSNNWLKKCNEMIYPFYIFHQTVIVIAAYYIVQWQAAIAIKLLALLAISLPVTILLCIAIYPFNPLRVLMGVKARNIANCDQQSGKLQMANTSKI